MATTDTNVDEITEAMNFRMSTPPKDADYKAALIEVLDYVVGGKWYDLIGYGFTEERARQLGEMAGMLGV